MSDDAELKAMNTVYEALNGLEEDAKSRVLDWAYNRFSLAAVKRATRSPGADHNVEDHPERALGDFESVGEVFAAAGPQSTADKALVVAAFLWKSKERKDIAGREINSELKHLGHGVTNITRAVEPLIKSRPQLLIQIRKEGKTKQAQKKYGLTGAGLARVNSLLSRLESDKNDNG